MIKEELEKYIKTLHTSKNCKYIIFVNKSSGLTKIDLAQINSERDDVVFCLIDGDPHQYIMPVETK